MATPLDYLETWTGALERYAQTLSEYVEIVDDVAQKTSPGVRAAYTAARERAAAGLGAAREKIAALGSEDSEGFALAEAAFGLLGALEEVREALDAGAAAAFVPALQEEATRRMSRTYVEGTAEKAKALRAEGPAAAAAARGSGAKLALAWAPRIARGDPAEVAEAYRAAPKTPEGAFLYADVLARWRAAGTRAPLIAELVEAAKDESLGLPPDTRGAAETAAAGRAGLHPLQAMGFTFGLQPAAAEADPHGAALVVDVTLPQATMAVRYDLAPLIDAQAAAKFGPLATIFSGLSYRLVQRLKTIEESPLPAGPRETPTITARELPGREAVLARTADGGASFHRLDPPPGARPRDFLSVQAGPRPRVARLGELLARAVEGTAGGVATTIEDPEALLQDYGAHADELEPTISLAELRQTLVHGFAAKYDLDPPATAEEFRVLALGDTADQDPFRTYIARAVSAVTKRAVEQKMLRHEAAGGSAPLFGPPSAAVRGKRRETLLTSLVQLGGAVEAARARLARAYDHLNAGEQAAAFLEDSAEAALRLSALDLYRRVAEAAFEAPARKKGPVEKLVTVEPRPTLKLYVLEHGDTSRRNAT